MPRCPLYIECPGTLRLSVRKALRLLSGSHFLGPSYLLWKKSGSPKEGLGTQHPTLPPPPKSKDSQP